MREPMNELEVRQAYLLGEVQCRRLDLQTVPAGSNERRRLEHGIVVDGAAAAALEDLKRTIRGAISYIKTTNRNKLLTGANMPPMKQFVFALLLVAPAALSQYPEQLPVVPQPKPPDPVSSVLRVGDSVSAPALQYKVEPGVLRKGEARPHRRHGDFVCGG
jgi:hypothetical protein